MEESPESPAQALLPISQNKGPARCYFMMMAIVYVTLALMAVVALGGFGIKQAEIARSVCCDPSKTCILFAKLKNVDGKAVIDFNLPGVCGYVLWGLISITIVAVVWLVYSIVLAIIGPKM